MTKEEKYISRVNLGNTDTLIRLLFAYHYDNDEEIKPNAEDTKSALVELYLRAVRKSVIAQYYICSKEVHKILKDVFPYASDELQKESKLCIDNKANEKDPDALFAKACLTHNISIIGNNRDVCPEWEKEADFAARQGSAWACLHLCRYYKHINSAEKAYEYLRLGRTYWDIYSVSCKYIFALDYVNKRSH